MNKFRTTERLSGLLAVVLSGLFYLAVATLILFLMKTQSPPPPAFHPAPVNLSFAQIELQSAAAPPPTVESEPPEEAEVAIEEPVAPPEWMPPEHPPEPRFVEATAQVTQQASAPTIPPVDPDRLIAWVQMLIEKEKYYPPAARSAGFEGQFRLLITIGTNGRVSTAVVIDGKGHPMLRRSLEKIAAGLAGRDFGQALPGPCTFIQPVDFKLN